jgi:1,4-dihydroxy-2-naphthoyl-CoA synthase
MYPFHPATTIDHGHLEATSVGGTAWRVSDATRPETDSLHVVAFVEARGDDDVEVVWLRGAVSAPGRFHDLDSALDAIDDAVTLHRH